jgi:hypothetical protein
MSRRQRVWLALAVGLVLAMGAVLFFGEEYRDDARSFLRNLIRAL